MRRRFENIKTVAGVKIPVFACSISAPTTTWRNPVPILGCRYRSNGATMAASYVLDEINNSKVCTMGGNPINCTISNSGQYIQAYFNEGQVTGDIILQFTIGDVFYYFWRLYTILHHLCYKTYRCYLISYSSFLTLFYSIESISPLFRTRRLSKRGL